MGNKKGVNTSSVEYSPARIKRMEAARKRQEERWAARASPVVVTRKPAVKQQGSGVLAKFPGRCWFCGKRFPKGTAIRFVQRETVHEEVCFDAAKSSQ